MESYDQTVARLETFAKEANPQADLSPGSVLSELIIKLSASLHNSINNDIAALSQANSVKNVIESTTDTYSEVIDEVASNFNTTRNEGYKSTGQVKVYVKAIKPSYLEPNFNFVQPNINTTYVVTQAWTVTTKTDADALLPGELMIKREETNSGTAYYFVVPVEASDVGPEYQIQSESVLVLGPNVKLDNFDGSAGRGAKAYGAFSSGKANETDKSLISRFQNGLTVRNLTSPKAIDAVLKERWPSIKTISIIGSNDLELSRAKHNLFGIAIPGKADVYVRTTEGLETSQFTVTGYPDSPGNSNWSLDIDWTVLGDFDAYGFYRVASVEKTGTDTYGTLPINSVTYDFKLGDENSNDVVDVTEARFTKYQTCTVDFTYTNEPKATEADFLVTVVYQPYIKDIQNLFVVDEERIACADYLVKAVVPCEVYVSLTLVPNEGTTLDVTAIKQAIFNYINNIPTGESLYASKIVDICHNFDAVKHVLLPITMKGQILKPTAGQSLDDIFNIENNDTLTIPTNDELTALGITQANTAFFAQYGNTTGTGIEINTSST